MNGRRCRLTWPTGSLGARPIAADTRGEALRWEVPNEDERQQQRESNRFRSGFALHPSPETSNVCRPLTA
jgi:hypothetical protein